MVQSDCRGHEARRHPGNAAKLPEARLSRGLPKPLDGRGTRRTCPRRYAGPLDGWDGPGSCSIYSSHPWLMEQADRGQELEGQIMALVARLADTAEGSATEAFIVRQLHGLRCDPRI